MTICPLQVISCVALTLLKDSHPAVRYVGSCGFAFLEPAHDVFVDLLSGMHPDIFSLEGPSALPEYIAGETLRGFARSAQA
jgi:hypothetical protein